MTRTQYLLDEEIRIASLNPPKHGVKREIKITGCEVSELKVVAEENGKELEEILTGIYVLRITPQSNIDIYLLSKKSVLETKSF